jgi:membrane protein YdbS with pleckstrin-like domain
MSGASHKAAAWIYSGLWGVLSRWFRVPRDPPTLPFHDAALVESFQPADAFLRYLKLKFWVLLTLIDGAILIGWVIIAIVAPVVGIVLALPALAIAVLPDIVAYIAIHLRYDTTWYVLTDRSMRIRRGIWVIHETTITFENVQNVLVHQGPLQRIYGIADVLVQTAGGGGGERHGEQTLGAHVGLLEGLADAPRIRDLILARTRESRSAGLGDEPHGFGRETTGSIWTPQHITALREIRDRALALASRAGD